MDVEEILPVLAVETALAARELRRVHPPGLQIVDGLPELPDPPLEGAQQRPGRAGEAPLEDAHREPDRRAVVERAVVDTTEVGGGEVVQRLLALRAGAQGVAEGVARALPVEGAAVQADHLLLGAADEVAVPLRLREAAERLRGREDPRVEQPPEVVPGRVLAHVRGRGEQQQMPRRPAETGEAIRRGGTVRRNPAV